VTTSGKTCPGCRRHKPVTQFWKNANRPDGLQHLCKQCLVAVQKRTPEEKARLRAARDAATAERRRLVQLDRDARRAAREALRRENRERRRPKPAPPEPVPPDCRRCTRCRKVKRLSAFPPSALYPTMPGGLCATCFPVVRPAIAFVGTRTENP
jgi:hypothetical protein